MILSSSPSAIRQLASEAIMSPQEAVQTVNADKRGMAIVIPKETELEETRLALTPDAVSLLINRGNEVTVEAGAGHLARFSDREYSEAGARIAYSAEEAYKAGNVVLKINPPSEEEIALIQQNSTVISALQTNSIVPSYVQALNGRKLTGVAFELLQDEVGNMPIVRAMSEIAGSTALLIAAEYLSSAHQGRGIILGGITGVPPTKVVILGAGSVGEFAARTAIGLGAEVKIFDDHLYKLRRIKRELGNNLFTSTLDIANLSDALERADVAIGGLRAEDGRSPCVVSEAMVSRMKQGAVIVDVSIDQGGCFETSHLTTHSNPVYEHFGVVHYCVPNVAARVGHTATQALSNFFTPLLLTAQRYGGAESLIFAKDWFMHGVYAYKGSLTNYHLAKRLNMRYKDLNLFRAARI